MNKELIFGLTQNIAVLLIFSTLYEYLWLKNNKSDRLYNKILTGIFIGGIGIMLMISPWTLTPGIVFDTRSILLSISGLFLGFIPTVTAIIITGFYRFSMGGDGMWMGVTVIVLSGAIGLIWRKSHPDWYNKKHVLFLLAVGFTVHIMMLSSTLLLPKEQIWDTLSTISIPVITIYPVGTMLLGLFLVRQLKNFQTENKLEESEIKFSKAFHHSPDVIILASLESGKFIEANENFEKFTGFNKSDYIGKNARELNLWHNENERELYLKILNEDKRVQNLEQEFKIKNGEIRSGLLSGEIIELKGEKVILAVIRDITDFKHTEKELIKARDKAEESDRLKSIFLANMSHEIRTPMNAIMGFSSLLNDPELDEPQRVRYSNIIQDSSGRLLRIIDDIIDISKIEAKQLAVNQTSCNICDILKNSVESFQKSELFSNKSNLTFTLNTPENCEEFIIETDRHRLQQVLDNIINNAIKYTEKGTIEVGFTAQANDEKNYIEFFVKDTGLGIPKDKKDIIFERFRQIEENSYHEGAGLGLSISKGIIDLLGGTIWFTSEENIGTTFFFTIPFNKAKIKYTKQKIELPKLNELQEKTIIIAEDDFHSFLYLKSLLQNKKLRLLHAEDGNKLMSLLEKSIPDLILLDIQMPGKNGYECLAEIKQKGIKTKIIAQTAYAMTGEEERCLEAGCDGYISKPINKTELFIVIDKVLSEG